MSIEVTANFLETPVLHGLQTLLAVKNSRRQAAVEIGEFLTAAFPAIAGAAAAEFEMEECQLFHDAARAVGPDMAQAMYTKTFSSPGGEGIPSAVAFLQRELAARDFDEGLALRAAALIDRGLRAKAGLLPCAEGAVQGIRAVRRLLEAA